MARLSAVIGKKNGINGLGSKRSNNGNDITSMFPIKKRKYNDDKKDGLIDVDNEINDLLKYDSDLDSMNSKDSSIHKVGHRLIPTLSNLPNNNKIIDKPLLLNNTRMNLNSFIASPKNILKSKNINSIKTPKSSLKQTSIDSFAIPSSKKTINKSSIDYSPSTSPLLELDNNDNHVNQNVFDNKKITQTPTPELSPTLNEVDTSKCIIKDTQYKEDITDHITPIKLKKDDDNGIASIPKSSFVRSGTRMLKTPTMSSTKNSSIPPSNIKFHNELVHSISPQQKLSFTDRLTQYNQNEKLPQEFIKLERLFNGLENIIFFNHNKLSNGNNNNSFHRIKKSVEEISKLNFSLEKMGQIREIYPEAYNYKPALSLDNGRRVSSFTIHANFYNSQNNSNDIENNKDNEEVEFWNSNSNNLKGIDNILRKRKMEFSRRLFKFVKISYTKYVNNQLNELIEKNKDSQKYIEKLELYYKQKYLNDNEDEIREICPGFDLNKHVDNIPFNSMNDVLYSYSNTSLSYLTQKSNEVENKENKNSPSIDKTKSKLDLLKEKLLLKKQERLNNEKNIDMNLILNKENNDDTADEKEELSDSLEIEIEEKISHNKEDKLLSGLKPNSKAAQMLESIRKRENERKELLSKGLILTPEQYKIKVILSKLLNIIQSIFSIYISKKKNVLALYIVAEQVLQGINTVGTGNFLSIEKIIEHIEFLAKASPLWCILTPLKMGISMKINRDYPLLKVRTDCKNYVKRVYNFTVTEF